MDKFFFNTPVPPRINQLFNFWGLSLKLFPYIAQLEGNILHKMCLYAMIFLDLWGVGTGE